MKNLFSFAVIVFVSIFLSSNARAQNLLVPNSNTDQVYLISGQDGSVISDSFLDIDTQATSAGVNSTPIEAREVGNELWVSDQVADRIWRFGRDRSFLGAVGVGELNNIRGFEVVGDTAYVAQGSAGTTFGEGIVTIDIPTLTVTGLIFDTNRTDADISYFDVLDYNGELLVTNIDSGNDAIERFSYDGNFLGFFAQSDGVNDFDFLQQLNQRQTNTNILGGGFSAPAGVYEFQSDGTNLGIVAGLNFGPRAAYELGNGEILWTNGAALQTDTAEIASGPFRFFGQTSAIPEPSSTIFIVGVLGLFCKRRREQHGS